MHLGYTPIHIKVVRGCARMINRGYRCRGAFGPIRSGHHTHAVNLEIRAHHGAVGITTKPRSQVNATSQPGEADGYIRGRSPRIFGKVTLRITDSINDGLP